MNNKLLILCVAFLSACGAAKEVHKYQLTDGRYSFRQGDIKYKQANIYVVNDTIKIFLDNDPLKPHTPDPFKVQVYKKKSFDVDVITIPFKFRPITAGLPRQLTTDFNGQLYTGFRIDRFTFKYNKTPVGLRPAHEHSALSVGLFGGLGSTAVTPWTTNNMTTDEYNGLIFSRGIALMVGVGNLTVGVGLGWDYLTDRDRDIWIYQNKPWLGLTFGLNIN